ncbi:MAG: porphobilinogen synthase [Flavobacteriales bacterium]|jgi:porphobilinogen synthase
MQLTHRNRRLRLTENMRSLVRENHINASDFIVPLFIVEGSNIKEEIPSMPNYYRFSLDLITSEIEEIVDLGLKSVLIFVKVPNELKDNKGAEALNPNGLMQRSIRKIKSIAPQLILMTDVALDPYSSEGHDGIVDQGQIINDETVEVLAQMSVSHAQAGADIVAPSDMMDGRVAAIRQQLDNNGFINTGIMSYSAKYASAFYGPFRDALDSAPGFGDKKTYQMDYCNRKEAIKEVFQDVEEGADIVMVKPGMPYLDVIRDIANVVNVPISAYQVSGEYAMIKAASANGWLNEKDVAIESIMAFKRAGASLIASYYAKDVARWLQEK